MGRGNRKKRVRKSVRDSAKARKAPEPAAAPTTKLPDVGPIVDLLTDDQRREFGLDLEKRFAPNADLFLALPIDAVMLAGEEAVREMLKALPLLESVELPAGGKAEAMRDRLREIGERNGRV